MASLIGIFGNDTDVAAAKALLHRAKGSVSAAVAIHFGDGQGPADRDSHDASTPGSSRCGVDGAEARPSGAAPAARGGINKRGPLSKLQRGPSAGKRSRLAQQGKGPKRGKDQAKLLGFFESSRQPASLNLSGTCSGMRVERDALPIDAAVVAAGDGSNGPASDCAAGTGSKVGKSQDAEPASDAQLLGDAAEEGAAAYESASSGFATNEPMTASTVKEQADRASVAQALVSKSLAECAVHVLHARCLWR